MKLNHFAVDMKLIQHCKLTTLQFKKIIPYRHNLTITYVLANILQIKVKVKSLSGV